MIRYFSFAFSQLSGIEKTIQPQLDFHIGDEHAFGMQLNDGPWWTPSQISYKAHLIACNHIGPRPQGPMGPRLQKPMSLGRYRLNARRALHAQCAKAFVQAQRAKGVTGSTREGRYKFNARKAWQARCAKGVTCSMREGRYKFNARRAFTASLRGGRCKLKARRALQAQNAKNNVCGSQNSACRLQNNACGFQNSARGLQNSACGLQNNACGLHPDQRLCAPDQRLWVRFHPFYLRSFLSMLLMRVRFRVNVQMVLDRWPWLTWCSRWWFREP